MVLVVKYNGISYVYMTYLTAPTQAATHMLSRTRREPRDTPSDASGKAICRAPHHVIYLRMTPVISSRHSPQGPVEGRLVCALTEVLAVIIPRSQ